MPKAVNPELKRQQILEACLYHFAERGYVAFSMRQIASSLGVTTGSLYHYFPSKRHILNGILLQRRERHKSAAQAALSSVSHPKERLMALCDFIEDRADAMSQLLLVAIDASRVGDKQEQEAIQFALSGYVQAVSILLPATEAVASLVIDIIFGHLLRHAIGGNTLSLRQLMEPLDII